VGLFIGDIAKAQEKIELILPWSSDITTKIRNFDILEDGEQNIYILGENRKNYRSIGANIIKFNKDGEIVWKKSYPTEDARFYTDKSFYQVKNGNIKILYIENLTHEMYCYSGGFGGPNSYRHKRIFSIDSETGHLLDHKQFVLPTDSTCKNEKLQSLKEHKDYYTLFTSTEILHSYKLEKLNDNFDRINSNYVVFQAQDPILSKFDDVLYGINNEGDLRQMNLVSGLENTIGNLAISPYEGKRKIIKENESYLLISISNQHALTSMLILVDKLQNKVIRQKFIPNSIIQSIDFLNNDEILILYNNRKHYSDTLSNRVKVSLLDISFNTLKEKVYGTPFIQPVKIISSNTGKSFLVVGWEINTDYSLDMLMSSNNSYFLKDEFANLNPVYRELDDDPLGANVFPNPTTGKIQLLLDPSLSEEINVQVFSTEGKMIKKQVVQNHSIELDISEMPIGVYYIVLESGGLYRKEKIVKMW